MGCTIRFDLERSKSKSLIVYHKGAEFGYMLLLNGNRKSFMKRNLNLIKLTIIIFGRCSLGLIFEREMN